MAEGLDDDPPNSPPVDPWAPDADARFVHPQPLEFVRSAPSVDEAEDTSIGPGLAVTDRRHDIPSGAAESGGAPGSDRRWRVAVAVAVALAGVVGAVVAAGDDHPEVETRGSVPESNRGPESLPAPERTLDEVRRDDARRDTGDDVVLGVGDVPLATGDRVCSSDRMPGDIEPRWSVEVESDGSPSRPPTVGGGLVFITGPAATESAATDGLGTVVSALDAVDGSPQWRADVEAVGDGPSVGLGVVDDLALFAWLERDELVDGFAGVARPGTTALVALSVATGDEVWRRTFDTAVTVEIDRNGSRLITHRASDDEHRGPPEVVALSVATGDEVWRSPGVLGDVGPDGSVAIVDDSGIVWASDVTARFDVVETDVRSVAIVGTSIVTLQEDSSELMVFERDIDGVVIARPLRITGSAGIDPPSRITQIASLGDSSLVIEGDRATHGANLSDGTVELRWRRAGSVVASWPSDRGRLLQLAPDDDPADLDLDVVDDLDVDVVDEFVDASTGRTVYQRRSGRTAVIAHADGITAVETADDAGVVGQVVRGVELGGRERWHLPGTLSFAVGDRVLVDVSPADSGDAAEARTLAVRAYGTVPRGAAHCGTVLREWVTS